MNYQSQIKDSIVFDLKMSILDELTKTFGKEFHTRTE